MVADAGQCVLGPCSATTVCVDTAAGHRCDPRFTGLVWKNPTGAAKFGNAGTFAPEVELVVAAGANDGGGLPSALTAQLPGMADAVLRRDGGTLLFGGASVVGSSLNEGTISLSVSFDGGSYWLYGGVTISVDKTMPTAALSIQMEPTRPVDAGWGTSGGWRRDEKPYVLLQATNEDIGTATVTVPGMTVMPAGALTECTNAPVSLVCPTSSRCRCFQLDLAQPAMNKLTDTFTVTGNLTDTAGNAALAVSTMLPVTRLRWSRAVAGTAVRSAPVISKDGVVVVATSEGATGNLVALNPDGTTKWTLTPGPIEGGLSMAVIGGKEYIAYATTTGALGGVFEAVNLANVTDKLTSCGPVGGTGYAAGIAVGNFANVTTFVATRNSGGGFVTRLHLLSNGVCDTRPAADAGSANNLVWPAAPVVSNATIVVPNSDGRIRAYDGVALPTNLANTNAGYPVDLSVVVPVFNGLALRLGGTRVVGGGAGLGQVFQLAVSNPGGTVDGGVDWRAPASMAGPIGAPALRGTYAYFGHNQPADALYRVDVTSANPSLLGPPLATVGLVQTFPVAGDSELYSLTGDGVLQVSDYGLTTGWPSTLASSAFASPTLDCSRPGLTAGIGDITRPGTLYLPLGNGTVAAIIVDSHRLEPTADWPKYQRDAYNSGNPTLGLSLNPGCP